VLQKVGLDDVYEGNDEIDGSLVKTQVGKTNYYADVVDEDKRPIHALLDVADGGLNIPHSKKRFPVYDRDSKEYDANMHRECIFCGHVGELMEYLEEGDNTKYQAHFAGYLENDIEADGLEELYEGFHEKIREDPSQSEKKAFSPDKSFKKKAKLTLEQRKAVVQVKKDIKIAELEEDDE